MYKMTLNDGTVIDGLKMKDCCLTRTEKMTPEMFYGKLNPVTIEGKPEAGEDEGDFLCLAGPHKHMRVVYIREADGEYRLALNDIPDSEYELAKLAGDIEYVAMMNGVNLEG